VALLADEVAASVRKARTRQPDQIGKVTQSKHVMEDAVVLAGTRIPVSTILDFHHDGYSVDGILAEYPELHPEDVQAAIEYETLLDDHILFFEIDPESTPNVTEDGKPAYCIRCHSLSTALGTHT